MWCHLLLLMPILGLGVFLVLPLPVALPTYLALAAASGALYFKVAEAMHMPVATGPQGMVGQRARAVTAINDRGQIRYRGEVWTAVAQEPVQPGDEVIIERVEGMQVHVRRALDQCLEGVESEATGT